MILAVAACNTTRSVPDTADAAPEASQRVAPGQALVYVVRDERFAAGRILGIELNEDAEVSLPAGSTQRWQVPAGEHVLRVAGSGDARLQLELASGERAFVRASVAVTEGRVGGRLTRLPVDRGREAVMRTRLLARE
jgi:hypothetical protein